MQKQKNGCATATSYSQIHLQNTDQVLNELWSLKVSKRPDLLLLSLEKVLVNSNRQADQIKDLTFSWANCETMNEKRSKF